MPARPAARTRRALGDLTNFGVALAAVTAFVLLAATLLRRGYASPDFDAMLTDDAGRRSGGWLSEIVLFGIRALPDDWAQQTALALLPAIAAGLLFGVLYHCVRDSDWGAPAALLLMVLLGGHALVLYAITSAGMQIPTLIALGALIPAIRRLESVGDVQADVSFGLVLPLLLLAGPQTAPLILPLAMASAIANPDGRRDHRAFIAMLLVAVMPTLIVIVGVVGFAMQAGIDPADLLVPYVRAFASVHLDGLVTGLADMTVLAPVAIIPIVYCFIPDRRRRCWSALAVVGLPVYLALGNAVFPWHLPAWVPAVAQLSTFAAWAAVARVRLPLRVATLALLAVAAAASWALPAIWTDTEWKAALLSAFH
ncbi:MAG: hypothetical protein HY834_02550 [Devosia nanyangense]|uniref:Uncharacterized protein n=1 Tax=Devosia nanyangense TaxID=1228055 RepID=A0A933NXG8_9HYPH|nr:hypothetical protein [Devosia nanyangense]